MFFINTVEIRNVFSSDYPYHNTAKAKALGNGLLAGSKNQTLLIGIMMRKKRNYLPRYWGTILNIHKSLRDFLF